MKNMNLLELLDVDQVPLRVGIDAHVRTLWVCVLVPRLDDEDIILASKEVATSGASVAKVINDALSQQSLKREQCDVLAAYEAGSLGFSLLKDLEKNNIPCKVLAPSTMTVTNGRRIKTDKRDALYIARELAYHKDVKTVHVPTSGDEAVRNYIRMRSNILEIVKKLKQQIGGFTKVNGYYFEGCYWTLQHRKWLRNLTFEEPVNKKTLDEYLLALAQAEEQLARCNMEIIEMCHAEEYAERTSKLMCFSGIKELQALSLVAEIGDFNRFPKAGSFASFLGLVPGEHSSGEDTKRLSITKAGNSYLRTLLIESAQGVSRSKVGYKSRDLKRRQEGCDPQVIAYADKCSNRLKRRYFKGIHEGAKHPNVVKVGMARELACFIWGAMTDHMDRLEAANQ